MLDDRKHREQKFERARAEAVAVLDEARTHVTRGLISLARLAGEDPDHAGAVFANELSKSARVVTTEMQRVSRFEREES